MTTMTVHGITITGDELNNAEVPDVIALAHQAGRKWVKIEAWGTQGHLTIRGRRGRAIGTIQRSAGCSKIEPWHDA